jgi:hypothetical protein
MNRNLALVVLLFFGLSEPSRPYDNPPTAPVPETLFGMHIHGMVLPRTGMSTPDPWPPVPIGTWRVWDAYVDWAHLEPQPGKWDFSILDKYVSFAEQHNVEILLPLAMSPNWASSRPEEKASYSLGNAAPPRNLDDWRNFVRTVGARYKGRIRYYEIWNEPNLKNFYTGTPQQMVDLTREAKTILNSIDPAIKVISPSATRPDGPAWLEQFFSKGGGKYVDIIGYHFYVNPAPPEGMLPLVQDVRSAMAKYGFSGLPIWNTETGWPFANRRSFVPCGLPDDLASAYVARSYVLTWASGVSRLYWYAWDNGLTGLTEADGRTLKPPAIAYGETEKWLLGARMTACGSDNSGTWNCEITRGGGYIGRIIWNPTMTLEFKLPKSWIVVNVRDLAGHDRRMSSLHSLEIGPEPLLLENMAVR